ncbi:tagatose-bisphosphate aldolase [Atopobacter sp. AH10]|uniref:tagatose-bisphosphate aldolase n=1 Tax=Atopobacter sp. AH10 TaxID=2315861 RepID=UPI000EF219A0|nr:tagatose-bisphosphate aldolase [Atopobacter sp. AH10]RLK62747.1 tagatose-bisphosphate aldolase [Atopobacter sp. AH10]
MSKLTISKEKYARLERLSDKNHVISALAIDQRGSLKRMLAEGKDTPNENDIVEYKKLVSKKLTPYASSILLDPEYGLPASELRHEEAGLLVAYEKTGYDATEPGRLPDLLPLWSARRLKEAGADAVKVLLYYDIDEGEEINEQKHAFVERIGSECLAEDMPFFLEIVTYDANIEDAKSLEYAKVKPHKVNDSVVEFSKDRYHVDVLKLEVPVNMDYVEGYAKGEVAYTKEEAKAYFKAQSDATDLPYIFLSAGVTAELFQETLRFAKEAGANFNGVLCGRATWKESVAVYAKEGEEACIEWLDNQGKKNMDDLNAVIEASCSSWESKVEVR